MTTMDERQASDGNKVVQVIEKADRLAKQLANITGGANDIGTFMKMAATERTKTREKLDGHHKKIEHLMLTSEREFGKNDKLIEELRKRTVKIEAQMRDVSHEFF